MMIRKGVVVDFMDHYIKIDKSVVMESLRRFVRAIVEVFGGEYLRSLINERRGFLGMLGSVDYMNLEWKFVLQHGIVSTPGMHMSQQ
jgi:hypothetical protein